MRVPDGPAGNLLSVAEARSAERAGGKSSSRLAVARAWLADLLRDSVHTVRQHDLTLAAAGLTFYAGIAVVPSLLLAVRLTALLIGADEMVRLGERVAEILPADLGAPDAVRTLVAAGTQLSWVGVLIAIFPASFYGEGLRRAFLRFSEDDDQFIGWRGRLLVLPLLIVAPVLLYGLLVVTPLLSRLASAGGAGSTLAGIVIGFLVTWLVLAVPLAWVFRVVAPGRPAWRAVIVGALATSSFVAGFLQGFVLFLSIPVDLGAPFGGLTMIGAVVAVGFWLFLLHVNVLVGYVVTRRLADRWPAPKPAVEPATDSEPRPAPPLRSPSSISGTRSPDR